MTLSRIHFVFFIVMLCYLYSCTKQTAAPDYLLSKEKMISIMADAYQLEAALVQVDKKKTKRTFFNKVYLPNLLAEHGTSKEAYDSSYAWYLSHHEQGLLLMNQVKDTLEDRKLRKQLYLPKLDTLNNKR